MEIAFSKKDYYLMCNDEEDLIKLFLLGRGVLKEKFGIDEHYKNVAIYGKRAKPDYKIDLLLVNNTDGIIYIAEIKFRPIRMGDLRQMARYISGLKDCKVIDIPRIARFKGYKTCALMIGNGKPKTLDKDLTEELDIYFLDEAGKLHLHQGEAKNPTQNNTDIMNMDIMKTNKYLEGVEWFTNDIA